MIFLLEGIFFISNIFIPRTAQKLFRFEPCRE